jgi:ElaA protein
MRGRGIGAAVMRRAVDELRARGAAKAKLGSQIQAIPFYEGLGFVAEGPVYDDAGAPHRDMSLAL